VRSTNGEITNTPATINTPERQVIAVKGPVHHWIEPWYLAYAILGALASGAERLYEEAIHLAGEHGFVQNRCNWNPGGVVVSRIFERLQRCGISLPLPL